MSVSGRLASYWAAAHEHPGTGPCDVMSAGHPDPPDSAPDVPGDGQLPFSLQHCYTSPHSSHCMGLYATVAVFCTCTAMLVHPGITA
jgi:hypothetical protein